jgi:hypothetical protein
MFSRKACYFFVRPKLSHLELCVFLGREVRARQIRKAQRTSKTKVAHLLRIQHRDEVEAPITDWLREAYGLQDRVEPKKKGPRKEDKKKNNGKKKKQEGRKPGTAGRRTRR